MTAQRRNALRQVAAQVSECRRCPGLNIPGETESAPGFGNVGSPVVFLGQSLCRKCMKTQVPFTGGSGLLIDEILAKSGLRKQEVFVTNVVHCHPPDNRPSHAQEIANCEGHLHAELAIVQPRLIVCLGKDAQAAASRWAADRGLPWRPDLPASTRLALLFAYHPAYIRRRPAEERAAYAEYMVGAIRWACGSRRSRRAASTRQ